MSNTLSAKEIVVEKVQRSKGRPKRQSQSTKMDPSKVAGNRGSKTKIVAMPGGGQEKYSASTRPLSSTVDAKYVFERPGEKGDVDETRVKKLKANPSRPAPLVRKSTIKLDKASKKKLIESRKAAAEKFKARSESTRKDLIYRKNAVARNSRRQACLKKSLWVTGSEVVCFQLGKLATRKITNTAKFTPTKLENISLIYAVGKSRKYKSRRKQFRDFRKFKHTLLKLSSSKPKLVEIIYEVGKSSSTA